MYCLASRKINCGYKINDNHFIRITQVSWYQKQLDTLIPIIITILLSTSNQSFSFITNQCISLT